MCAKATPPGGMVATFTERCLALVFLPERPVLYRIPFQPRVRPLPRSTTIPSCPSTAVPASASGVMGGYSDGWERTVLPWLGTDFGAAIPVAVGELGSTRSHGHLPKRGHDVQRVQAYC